MNKKSPKKNKRAIKISPIKRKRKRKSLKKSPIRKSRRNTDGNFLRKIYNSIKNWWVLDERRIRPFVERTNNVSKSTPESSKVTTRNDATTIPPSESEITNENYFLPM